MRRALPLVTAVILLLPLTACAPPAPGTWLGGRPIHPRMVTPPPPPVDLSMASCVVGLTLWGDATARRLDEDPYMVDIDEWAWWFYGETLGQYIPAQQDCWNAVFNYHILDRFTLWYDCGGGIRQYTLSHDVAFIRFFVQNYVCDGYGFAYFDCQYYGQCLGFGTIAAIDEAPTTTEPGRPPVDFDTDPNDPHPVDTITCAGTLTDSNGSDFCVPHSDNPQGLVGPTYAPPNPIIPIP